MAWKRHLAWSASPSGLSPKGRRTPRERNGVVNRHRQGHQALVSTPCRVAAGDREVSEGSCMKRVVLALMIAAALGGCSAGSFQRSSGFTREAECARNGGVWNSGEGAYAFCRLPQ